MPAGMAWKAPAGTWTIMRFGFTPFLAEYYTDIPVPFSPWAGISVGYNFGKPDKM